MKNKKHSENPDEKIVVEQATDNIAEPSTASATEQEQEIPVPKSYTEEEYQLKVNELNDKLLRLHSEFDNFRKRSFKEKIDMSRTASEEVIKDLIT